MADSRVNIAGVAALGILVAASLAGYVAKAAGQAIEEHRQETAWQADHAGLVEVAARLDLPAGYTETDCADGSDSRCWTTPLPATAVATDVTSALTSAGVGGLTSECHDQLSLKDGWCSVSAPFGHDRSVTVSAGPDVGHLTREEFGDPTKVAELPTTVTFVIPAL